MMTAEEIGSGSCPVSGFGIIRVKTLIFSTEVFISIDVTFIIRQTYRVPVQKPRTSLAPETISQ